MKVYLFQKRQIVLRSDPSMGPLPSAEEVEGWLGANPESFKTELRGVGTALAFSVSPDWQAPPEAELTRLRAVPALFPEAEAALILKAGHLAEWRRTSRFCGACGVLTAMAKSENAMVCPSCHHQHFPRVAPAVIVQAVRGDYLLLGRASRHPPGGYSILAGFVDPGESLEEAVVREVKEESGVVVSSTTYFGSQPWPFPDALMIGFTAECEAGEPSPHDHELEEVAWFHVDDLPLVPPHYSIARTLIDHFVVTRGRDPKSLASWPA